MTPPYDVVVRFGCGERQPKEGKTLLEVVPPGSIGKGRTGKLHMLIHYRGARGARWAQRESFEKPGPYCVELSKRGEAVEFHLFVEDEQTEWIGAVNVRVEDSRKSGNR